MLKSHNKPVSQVVPKLDRHRIMLLEEIPYVRTIGPAIPFLHPVVDGVISWT